LHAQAEQGLGSSPGGCGTTAWKLELGGWMNGEVVLAFTTLRHRPCAAWRAKKKFDALSLPAHTTGCPGDEQLQENVCGVGSGVAVRWGVGTGVGIIGATTCAWNSAGHIRASPAAIATIASHPLRTPVLDLILIWFSIPLACPPRRICHCRARPGLV
jgi:hypothetical protein